MSVVSQHTLTCTSVSQLIAGDNSTVYESGLGKPGQKPDFSVVAERPFVIGCDYQVTVRKLKSPTKEPK